MQETQKNLTFFCQPAFLFCSVSHLGIVVVDNNAQTPPPHTHVPVRAHAHTHTFTTLQSLKVPWPNPLGSSDLSAAEVKSPCTLPALHFRRTSQGPSAHLPWSFLRSYQKPLNSYVVMAHSMEQLVPPRARSNQ